MHSAALRHCSNLCARFGCDTADVSFKYSGVE